MTVPKKQILEIINNFPEEVDIDEMMYRLYLKEKIELAEQDVKEGNLVSHDDVVKDWFLESKIKWTKRALSDLKDIHDYIKKDYPQYAKIQIEKIQKATSKIKSHPKIGRILPEFPKLPYREIISGNYRIVYRYDKK